MCTYRIRSHFGPKIVARLAQATLQFELHMAYFSSANDLVEARMSLRPVTSKCSATTVTTASAEQATAPVPGPLPVFTASAEQAQHNFGHHGQQEQRNHGYQQVQHSHGHHGQCGAGNGTGSGPIAGLHGQCGAGAAQLRRAYQAVAVAALAAVPRRCRSESRSRSRSRSRA